MWAGRGALLKQPSWSTDIPMKFESHWPKGSGGVSFYGNYLQFSIFSSGGHFVHRSGTVLAILVEGHLSNIPMKFK